MSVAAVVAITAGVVLAMGDGDQAKTHVKTKLALTGSIDLSPTAPRPGEPVIGTITIRADRPVQLADIVLSVRDSRGRSMDAAGRDYDFPATGPIRLGAKERTLTVGHQFPIRGTYSYFLRYRIGKTWHTLPPYNTFTVG